MATNVKASDETFRQNILATVRCEGGAPEVRLRVDVCDRVATLTGRVNGWAERLVLERGVHSVKGVRPLVLALENRAGKVHFDTNREIALAAMRRLQINGAIPEEALLLDVGDGLITLGGEVERYSHRSLAENIVLGVAGVRGVRKAAFASPPSASVNVNAYPSLAALAEDSCRRFDDKPAFTSMGVTISFRRFEQLTEAFAGYLQNVLRLNKGVRLAVMLPNILQAPVAIMGALRAGMTVVNVSPLHTAPELEFQLADSGAEAIVVLENFMHTLLKALARTPVRHVIVTQVGDLFPHPRREIVNFAVRRLGRKVPAWDLSSARRFERALEEGALNPLTNAALQGEDLAFIQYTGGTTGRPKGAMLTHANMVANVQQTAAWIGKRLKEGEETVVTALPLDHLFALTANLLVFLKLGGNNFLIADPRDLGTFVAQLRKSRFTAITGVNTLFRALLDAPGFDAVCAANRGRLKLAVAGGMAMQRDVAERWQAATGVPIVEGYGLTEAAPIVSANPVDSPGFSGTLGWPLPLTEVAILDDAQRPVAPGTVGEICVRGPQVMSGYWHAPEESANVFTADGWLRTGDLGRMDERGELSYVDRRKDIIVVSGLKAYPAEIEDVVRRHPGVKEVGAVGVPDPKSGEAVALFVVKRDPGLEPDALRRHCRAYLAAYMQPRYIEFLDELPMSPVGKVLRRVLRDHARNR